MQLPWKRPSSSMLKSRRRVRSRAPRAQDPQTAIQAAHDRILDAARMDSGGACGYAGLRTPAQTTVLLGELSKLSEDLDQVLGRVDRYLRRESTNGRLTAVEGVFAGDADSAVATTHLWLDEATSATGKLREAIDNAQIATSGLATPARREEPARSR